MRKVEAAPTAVFENLAAGSRRIGARPLMGCSVEDRVVGGKQRWKSGQWTVICRNVCLPLRTWPKQRLSSQYGMLETCESRRIDIVEMECIAKMNPGSIVCL